MFGLLVCWFVGWLVGWLVGWFLGFLVRSLVGWLWLVVFGLLVCWFIGWFVKQSVTLKCVPVHFLKAHCRSDNSTTHQLIHSVHEAQFLRR